MFLQIYFLLRTCNMFLKMRNVLFIALIKFVIVSCRIHKLTLTDDQRPYVDLTTFGLLKYGILEVKMINFKLPSTSVGEYGFTIDRTINDAISPYPEATDGCLLAESDNSIVSAQHPAIIFLKMDFKNLRLNNTCVGEVKTLNLYVNRTLMLNKDTTDFGDYKLSQCAKSELPITKLSVDGYDYYNTSFAMYVSTEAVQGLYNVYFHNCPRAQKVASAPSVDMLLEIFEINNDNYLSAGEIPLPRLYAVMSLVFLTSAVLWTYILRTSKHQVFKIHIIMCVLVYLKALSLAFHGINYHFIQIKGEHVTAWAILYYITHLLKGAVLFVTIVLVGTGWNFIKHILAERDKKLFMIVIPLQVVANVAEIILAESEEGAVEHNAWRSSLWILDLMCCGAILFPVVWSIRHLQDASATDGKATINLRKLKLFRHFYIMVVSYIYFTRIIICLLKIIVAFQYAWIDELFREMATLLFFVTTGYKFRPAAANPYFTPNHIDDEEAQVLSKIGILEGVTKIPKRGEKKEDMQPLIQDTNCNSD